VVHIGDDAARFHVGFVLQLMQLLGLTLREETLFSLASLLSK
jgi:hypothetical protein